jgi:hypothetical protein
MELTEKLKSMHQRNKKTEITKAKINSQIIKNTDLFKNTQKSLKLVVEFATKNTDLLAHTVGKCSRQIQCMKEIRFT